MMKSLAAVTLKRDLRSRDCARRCFRDCLTPFEQAIRKNLRKLFSVASYIAAPVNRQAHACRVNIALNCPAAYSLGVFFSVRMGWAQIKPND